MRDFKTYRVWHHAIELVTKVYQLLILLPASETYTLSQQMRRAAISIASNIAEGCGRDSDKEFGRFVEMSLSSAFELETQMLIGDNLFQISTADIYQETHGLLIRVQKELNSLRNRLK